jgi:hypothetical protein
MRICFLLKRWEKREEMVRPIVVVALAMGTRRGLKCPWAFFHTHDKLSGRKEKKQKKKGSWDCSPAGVFSRVRKPVNTSCPAPQVTRGMCGQSLK